MHLTRLIPAAFATVVLFLPSVAVADDEAPAQTAPERTLNALKERFTQILPKGAEEKLNLTDDQKKEIAKLQKELDAKVQKAFLRAALEYPAAKDAFEKARVNGDFDLLGDSALTYASQALDAMKMRREVERKLRNLLTEDQKRVYEELRKEERLERRRERRAERP